MSTVDESLAKALGPERLLDANLWAALGHTIVGTGPVGVDYDDCSESFMPVADTDEIGALWCPWCEDPEREHCANLREPHEAITEATRQLLYREDSFHFGHHQFSLEPVERFTQSFDACLRDIVPVLRARGLYWRIDTLAFGEHAYVATVGSWKGASTEWEAINIQPPAAFCEAALKALEATND